MGIVAKCKEEISESTAHKTYSSLGKVFEVADKFKNKIITCKVTKGKGVHLFIKGGDLNQMQSEFVSLTDNWECPEKAKQKMPNDLLSAGFDWKYVEQLKTMLRNDPKPMVGILSAFLKSKGYLTKQTEPVYNLMSEQLVNNKDVLEYILSFVDSLESFFKAESGKRIINIIPQLLTADSETALELFAREADYNQEAFFNLLKNGDLAGQFLKQMARLFITSFKMARDALDDNLKFAIINGMLISNNFPAVDKRNLLKSCLAIFEKGFKLVTTSRYELNLYKEVKVVTDEFEKLYFKFDEFSKLNEDELENVISQFLSDNILQQAKDAWIANRHVTMVEEKCAEYLLCRFNEKYKGSKKTNNAIVKTMTKGIAKIVNSTSNFFKSI